MSDNSSFPQVVVLCDLKGATNLIYCRCVQGEEDVVFQIRLLQESLVFVVAVFLRSLKSGELHSRQRNLVTCSLFYQRMQHQRRRKGRVNNAGQNT